MNDVVAGGAQTIVDAVAADVAAFPVFVGLVAVFVAAVVVWSVVEVAKATALASLKRPPPKGAGEDTVIGRIARTYRWYPVVIWALCLCVGGGAGAGIGAIDGYDAGDLGMWGIPLGVVGGLLAKVLAQYGRKLSDKISDAVFGWIKRKVDP